VKKFDDFIAHSREKWKAKEGEAAGAAPAPVESATPQ